MRGVSGSGEGTRSAEGTGMGDGGRCHVGLLIYRSTNNRIYSAAVPFDLDGWHIFHKLLGLSIRGGRTKAV